MSRKVKCAGFLLAVNLLPAAAQEPADRFYQAIRNNDIPALRGLLKTLDVNMGDKRGTTPLMYAAAFGSADAMKLFLAGGANVNAKNAFDATALMWCATDIDKVRLLLAKGADVNARSKPGRTSLLIAAASDGSSEIVKLLLAKGADVAARDSLGATALSLAADAGDAATVSLLLAKGADANAKDVSGQTPLDNAAAEANLEIMRMLLSKGADPNTITAPTTTPDVKNGPIALGSLTPLLLAVPCGGPETVKLLLDAGAKVNVKDVRGMTPLMLAVASDHADPEVIRLLLEKGADPAIKSNAGETAADWARKINHPPVLKALGLETVPPKPSAAVPAGEHKPGNPREAAEKSLALLQRTGGSFFKEGGCVSCHAQNVAAMAVGVARSNGIGVDEAASAEQVKTVKALWSSVDQVLLQRMDPPGAVDTIVYSILHLLYEGAAPDRTTDAMVHNIVGEQRKPGNWHLGGVARAPAEDGDFFRTALAIRSLQVYGPPGRKAEFDKRIERASSWLAAATPQSTEDRDMQLLGLKWAGADRRSLDGHVKELMGLQNADGGWAQTPGLGSDAYATGQALYTLHELGVSASDPAWRRGVEFLLRTQLADGSWYVKSRSPKFQPYFQSGFPHDHDQWISTFATGWATMALSFAASDKPTTASLAHQQ